MMNDVWNVVLVLLYGLWGGWEYKKKKKCGQCVIGLLYLDIELWQDNNDVYSITLSTSAMLEAQFCADFYRCVCCQTVVGCGERAEML